MKQLVNLVNKPAAVVPKNAKNAAPQLKTVPQNEAKNAFKKRQMLTSLAGMPLFLSAQRAQASILSEEPPADQIRTQIDKSQVAERRAINRPDLLPSEQTPVIDLREVLTKSETRFVKIGIKELEDDTGFKIRVIAQSYPETPGKAVKDYWGVNDNTIVIVEDPLLTNEPLNFNVGGNVPIQQAWFEELRKKFGSKFVADNGESQAITRAVAAIDQCIRGTSEENPSDKACDLYADDFDYVQMK